MSRDILGMPDDFANRWIIRIHTQLEAEFVRHREHLPVLDVHKSKHLPNALGTRVAHQRVHKVSAKSVAMQVGSDEHAELSSGPVRFQNEA